MNARAIREIVGDDLSELIAAQGLPVVSIEPVSSLSSATWPRAAFHFTTADGASFKGRRLESPEAARRAVTLGGHLPDGAFPRVLAWHNAALLLPWIEGAVLSSAAVTEALLHELGAIQRSVHALHVPPELPDAADEYPGVRWREDFTARTEWLASVGEITAGEGQTIVGLALAHVPDVCSVRLVHGDMCPENVIVDRHGRPRVVDNDGIDFHAPEFDLARTWYRWPMTAEERAAFENGYGDAGVLASYHQHFLHWALIVLVGAIEFRVRFGLGGTAGPVARLRELLV